MCVLNALPRFFQKRCGRNDTYDDIDDVLLAVVQIVCGENCLAAIREEGEQLTEEGEEFACVGNCKECPAYEDGGNHVEMGDGAFILIDFKEFFDRNKNEKEKTPKKEVDG